MSRAWESVPAREARLTVASSAVPRIRNTPPYTSAILVRILECGTPAAWPHRAYPTPCTVRIRLTPELPAQLAHADAHGAGERIGVGVPGPLQQLLRADGPTVRLQQQLEHRELLRREVQLPPVPRGRTPYGVEPDAVPFQLRRDRAGAAAAQRPDAGHQLRELERLAQVVVGAEVEPGDPVLHGTGGGEHQDPGPGAGGDEPARHVVAVHPRQVAVQDDDVVVVQPQVGEGGVTAVHRVDGEPGPPQSGGDQLRQDLLVLGDQYPHRDVPCLVHACPLPPRMRLCYGKGCFAKVSTCVAGFIGVS